MMNTRNEELNEGKFSPCLTTVKIRNNRKLFGQLSCQERGSRKSGTTLHYRLLHPWSTTWRNLARLCRTQGIHNQSAKLRVQDIQDNVELLFRSMMTTHCRIHGLRHEETSSAIERRESTIRRRIILQARASATIENYTLSQHVQYHISLGYDNRSGSSTRILLFKPAVSSKHAYIFVRVMKQYHPSTGVWYPLSSTSRLIEFLQANTLVL